MHATDEAEREIERTERLVERAQSRRELRSHLHEAAARRASAAGRDAIEPEDVRAALREAGGAAALARLFERAPRAPMGRRAIAHGVDLLLVHALAIAAWSAAWLAGAILHSLWGVETPWLLRPQPYQFIDVDNVPSPAEWAQMPGVSLAAGALVGVFVVGLPFLYFLLGDLRSGRTLGKRALGLRAEGEAGRVPVAAAVLRAALKASILLAPLLALDAAIGRGARWSDRMLRVRVVDEADERPDAAGPGADVAST